MKEIISRYGKLAFTLFWGIGIFLFWYAGYPQALCYQEQNQLFLWSTDYLCHDLSVAGGLADYISEFLVQFYYIPWIGAAVLACLFMAFLSLTWKVIGSYTNKGTIKWYWNIIALLPSLWLLAVMGDIEVLLSFPVALTLSFLAVWQMNVAAKRWGPKAALGDILLIPVLFWLIGGGATWLYVILRVVYFLSKVRKGILPHTALTYPLTILYFLAVQLVCYSTLLVQYPLPSVIIGINYYRVPQQYPGKNYGYDKDLYALLKLNKQVRDGEWNDIIHDAERHQVKTTYTSNCVNLALAKTRQLADRMFTFFQSGDDALLVPRTRDNMSMYPTMEAFWQLGLVNSSLRYATDLQASILNGKQSGRLMKRMTECQLANGNYKIAKKNIDVLKQSLFYRAWAEKAETMLGNEAAINNDPDLERVRRIRFKKDMIFSYAEIDKMMGLLFVNNSDNKMALDYFMGEMLLKGNIQGFMQYGSWVEQYGGYSQMPVGYRDAVICIQNHGNVQGSPYAEYVQRMMNQAKGGEQ